YNIIVPCTLTSWAIFLVVIIPSKSDERINLLALLFASFLFIQNIISTIQPKNEPTPLLATYVMACIGIIGLAIVLSVAAKSIRFLPKTLTPPLILRFPLVKIPKFIIKMLKKLYNWVVCLMKLLCNKLKRLCCRHQKSDIKDVEK